jgi:hypothetical protein
MTTLFLAALLLAGGKETQAKQDPNQAVAKSHGGKVWTQGDVIPELRGDELGHWLGAHPSTGEIKRKAKEGPWSIQFVAVFKHPAAKGPMTVQFAEKKDPKNLVDQFSPEIDAATLVFRGAYDLDPDRGFNAGHTYVVRVGQIIKQKFVPYATGELTLK